MKTRNKTMNACNVNWGIGRSYLEKSGLGPCKIADRIHKKVFGTKNKPLITPKQKKDWLKLLDILRSDKQSIISVDVTGEGQIVYDFMRSCGVVPKRIIL